MGLGNRYAYIDPHPDPIRVRWVVHRWPWDILREKDDSLKLKLRKNMRYRQRSNWKRSHEDAVMREFGGPQSPHNFLAAKTDHHIHGGNLTYRLQWHFHWNPWKRKSGNMAHSIFPLPSNSAFEAYWTYHAQSHVIVVDGSVCSDESHIAHISMGSRGKSGKVSFNIIFTCIGVLHCWTTSYGIHRYRSRKHLRK